MLFQARELLEGVAGKYQAADILKQFYLGTIGEATEVELIDNRVEKRPLRDKCGDVPETEGE